MEHRTAPKLSWRVRLMALFARRTTATQTYLEAALRASEEKCRSLFASMPSGFAHCRIILDPDGKPADFVCLTVNDAFEKLTGLKKEDVLNKRITEVIPVLSG